MCSVRLASSNDGNNQISFLEPRTSLLIKPHEFAEAKSNRVNRISTFTALLGILRHRVQRNEQNSYVNKTIIYLFEAFLANGWQIVRSVYVILVVLL